MNGSGLILAAHGSRHDTAANECITDHARRIAHLRVFKEVSPAFHHGEPSFAGALDAMAATDVTVVPVLSAAGYFCRTVLPSRLAAARRSAEVTWRVTEPVGTHIAMFPLVLSRACSLVRIFNLNPAATSIALVGHGTPRHGLSRRSTDDLADRMRASAAFADARAFFLDDVPDVGSVRTMFTTPAIAILPLLMSPGPHASRDIPERAGLATPSDARFPTVGRVGRHTVVCDRPIGADPRLTSIILLRAAERGNPLAHGAQTGIDRHPDPMRDEAEVA